MVRILVFQNDTNVPPGYLGAACAGAGVDLGVVELWNGAPVPDLLGWDGVVSLGGHMGAYEEAAFPFLADEKRCLSAATHAGIPTLGLCLGSQLLADALGGEAYLADAPEVAVLSVDLTPEGESDPVVGSLDGPLLVFHQDTWRPPPGATLLAATGRFPQAFRYGSAIGVQPHPEATPGILDEWLNHDAAREMAHRAGTDPDRLAQAYRDAESEIAAGAVRFFGAWLAEVEAKAAAASSHDVA